MAKLTNDSNNQTYIYIYHQMMTHNSHDSDTPEFKPFTMETMCELSFGDTNF